MASLTIAQDPVADRVLSEDPFALLVGMLLDQQFPMERAFAGPAKVLERFGTLDPRAVAAADPEAFADLCATPPAVHRYGRSMAGRIQALAVVVRDEYAGDASALWRDAATAPSSSAGSGAARLRRAEGEDLHGPARQAARHQAPRLGAGVRRLRRDRLLPLGRRRRRPRLPAAGARLQEGGQGRREVRGLSRRGRAPSADDRASSARPAARCPPTTRRAPGADDVGPGHREPPRCGPAPRAAASTCAASRASSTPRGGDPPTPCDFARFSHPRLQEPAQLARGRRVGRGASLSRATAAAATRRPRTGGRTPSRAAARCPRAG